MLKKNIILLLLSPGIVLASFFITCPQDCDCEGPRASCQGGKLPPLDPRSTQLSFDYADPPLTVFSMDFAQHMDQLVSLEMSSVGLTKLEQGALGMMRQLSKLNITNNNITILELGTFDNCSKLASVSLDNNNIQVIENGTFTSLTSLVNLSLAQNALSILPGNLPVRIKQLDLEYNQITEIPSLFYNRLTALNLCYNSISKINQVDLKKLMSFCLGGTNITVNESFINKGNFPELASLTLQGKSLAVSPAAAKNIKEMSTLRSLELDSCILPDMQIFSQANSTLENLRVSDITFKRALRTQSFTLPSVHTFDVSGSPVLARFFLTTPPRHGFILHELKILMMSRCKVETFYESLLLSKAPNIEKLDLSHNPLDCNCNSMSWIQDYVRKGRLSLFKEENTTCATPKHLAGVPLLTATMCPIIFPGPTKEVTTALSTINTVTKNQPTQTSPVTTASTTPEIYANITQYDNTSSIFTTKSPNTFATIIIDGDSASTTMPADMDTSTAIANISANTSGLERSGSPNTRDLLTPTTRHSTPTAGVVGGTLLILMLIATAIGVAIRKSRKQKLTISQRRAENRENMIAMSDISDSQDQLI